jgi:hypothetical protein
VRTSRAALALVVLTSLGATEVFAAEPWYEAYDSALKAVAARQWAVAETKLKAAMKDGPRPGRRVRTYGMRFVDYLPDYYLGLVYFNQQRQREALEQLRKVSASGLLSEGDAEYRSLASMIEKAEASLAPRSEPTRAPAETTRVAVEAPPKPPPSEAPRALAEAPRTSSEPPREATPPPREAGAAPPPTPRPRGPETPALAVPVPKRPVAASSPEIQKAALHAFFAGRYEESAQKLDAIATGPGRTAPTLFYLGASHAALGLLRDEGRSERLDRARRAFTDARSLDPRFEADPGLVSPRILKLWRESRP